jgi:hypothetical protein
MVKDGGYGGQPKEVKQVWVYKICVIVQWIFLNAVQEEVQQDKYKSLRLAYK